ncbi:hypothetical protein RSAG8_03971, partial [Rhizoctonia solani AG-8 WAC10335]
MKEELKGKITRNHELEQKGKERKTRELSTRKQVEGDARNPFHNKEEEEQGAQNPTDTANKTESAQSTEITPGAHKTDTDGAPPAERIPSSTGFLPPRLAVLLVPSFKESLPNHRAF